MLTRKQARFVEGIGTVMPNPRPGMG